MITKSSKKSTEQFCLQLIHCESEKAVKKASEM